MARHVAQLGRGALLAKMDIYQAYRMVQVHPDNRALLGMRWDGGVYIDTRLHFGLRSALIIFTAVADALEWCIRTQGVTYIRHYLDNFITAGSPGSMECAAKVQPKSTPNLDYAVWWCFGAGHRRVSYGGLSR